MNPVPTDPPKLPYMSGVRFGTSACTTRGFGPAEFETVGDMIAEVLATLRRDPGGDTTALEAAMMERTRAITRRFPIYPG
jgi:glycine hydroxymethyltransferase